ncbi:DUF3488 and transglutaminase-like domain-containing protein [Oceanicoccus sp. KOV_DT_Chl]|uniref:transglutaminase TgpA family protein n=1 Tax=Oceanicoccus sp. KOV_DT_Chl TaxID=1904639 RepID=UPI000C7B0A2B|nr:DUF3488 and transglutaminase-like domain-containing protein [Oceanicoccus sp. KOV_DT_Chl]
MAVSWQVPRNCLAWILISQMALIAPHFERLPWWVLASYAICACWRIMIYQGRWSKPPSWLKILLTLLCCGGIYQSYGSLIGMEPTVALLITGFCLKLLELSSKRDVYVLLFLAYFVAITAFLFSQNFFLVVFVFFTSGLITTALVALHQHHYQQFELASLKKGLLIVLQSVPIMVVLFIIFPRFEPLWKVPSFSEQAKTGVSEVMSPGDISQLSNSSDLAFRAVFRDEVPARNKLYWRGLVLSEFDGRSWRQGRRAEDVLSSLEAMRLYNKFENPISYRIIQEATYRNWLFTLALAYSKDPTVRMVNDYRLISTKEISKRIEYQIWSDTDRLIQPELSSEQRLFETRLPEYGNPESHQFAQRLHREAGSDQKYIDAVLAIYRQQKFVYTLSPPALGEHSIDEFLFTTKRGFCSHYASSFVFLMRAVGIPARVVAGYMGGEINPLNGTVLVHQFDAHGWAEVWLPGEGWRRVDPTGAVSPDRIEFGLEAALAQEGDFLSGSPLSPLRYRKVAWINKLRLQLDAFNYYWSIKVLQYDDKKQRKTFNDLLGGADPWRIGVFLMAIGGLVMGVIGLRLLKGRGKPQLMPEVRLYLKLCDRLQKKGFVRENNEGAIEFARRVAKQQPLLKTELLAVTRSFVDLSYTPLDGQQKKLLFKQYQLDLVKLNKRLVTIKKR